MSRMRGFPVRWILRTVIFITLTTAGPRLFASKVEDPGTREERKGYESWQREIQDRRTARDAASRNNPGAAQARDNSAAQAAERFLRERMKEDDEYNARVARENARIDALNADYDRLRGLAARAQAGDAAAMRQYGQELMTRASSDEHTKEIGRAWMREASDHGDVPARQWVAEAKAAAAQQAAAAEEASRAAARTEALNREIANANAGEVAAMRWVGLQYYFSKDPAERELGRGWLRRAAALNDVATLEFLVDRYRWGTGTAEELTEALAWRVQLAQLPGHAELCLKVGDDYLTGRFGAPKDRAIALTFLEKAAAAGKIDAELRMAEAFARGIGGPRDVREGIARYKAALAVPNGLHTSKTKSAALLELSRLMLDPESAPKAHAAELLALWDGAILEYGEEADALGRLAFDALSSGLLGVNDPDREWLYLSRPLVYGSWPDLPPGEFAELAWRFGETVARRSRDDDHPLFIVEKREVRKTTPDGNSWTEPEYHRIRAQLKESLRPLVTGAWQSVEQNAERYLLAAAVAAELGENELKAMGYGPDFLFKLFKRAAETCDDSTAWLESGRILATGRGVPADPVAGQQRLETAWNKGVARAAFHLAYLQQRRLVPAASEAGYRMWIQRGAEKFDPACMEYWGKLLVAKIAGEETDPAARDARIAEGVSWAQKAADAGQFGAMSDLAAFYHSGIGVQANEATCVAWLMRASAGDSGAAKNALAERYAEGNGVEKNLAAALKLLREAAPLDAIAANNLGVKLWRGDWGEKDVASGLGWMEAALDAGNWRTARSLAKIYHLGLEVSADEAKARAYLDRAGEMEGAVSAAAVAEFYERGEIITKDADSAQRWREKASASSAPPGA